MLEKIIQEWVGKECTITLFNEMSAVQGKILAVEDNWLKVEEKRSCASSTAI